MEWLIAGAFALVGLITAVVVLIGQKNPKLKPYIPGIVRYSGAFGLGHPTDPKAEKEGREVNNEGRPPER
jgi:hypothetical protein